MVFGELANLSNAFLSRYCGSDCQAKLREEHREECKQNIQEREEREGKEDQEAALLLEALNIPASEVTYSMWEVKFNKTLNKFTREQLKKD